MKKPNKKRNVEDYKNDLKKKVHSYEYVNPKKNKNRNDENSDNEQNYKYPKKNNRKALNDKLLNHHNNNNSIVTTSKESLGLIQQILTQKNEENNDLEIKNENENNEKNNIKQNGNNKKSTNSDNFLLSSIYDLFEGYDEIIIKPISKNQYIINASIRLEENAEIRFEIIYDNERDYFDYYSNNKNFRFENEDEPFNHDLDIPKSDFVLLIKNFKKFKFKNK